MQQDEKILIIGQGALGLPLAERLASCYAVTTVARSPKQYQQSLRFWQQDMRQLKVEQVEEFSRVVVVVAPNKKQNHQTSEASYQESYLAICQHLANLFQKSSVWSEKLKRLVFISSTSVYGENEGQLIDESTVACAATKSAQVLLQSENVLRETFGDKAVMVRASGIYGVNRTRMIKQAQSAHQDGVVCHHFTNRIMDSDLITIIERILFIKQPKPIYLATDFCSVTSAEVFKYIADLAGFKRPNLIEQSSPSGKKIIANIEKQWLDFPDYQSGYYYILQQNHLLKT